MTRVRISTTVDADRLARCRGLVSVPDSKLMDQALAALEREAEAIHEAAVLSEHPYEEDFDLDWAPAGPDLEYDGPIPQDVLDAAEKIPAMR